MYRFTSCGTLNKSSFPQVLSGLLSLNSSVAAFYYTPLPPTSVDERTLPGKFDPILHHLTDVGERGRRTKSVGLYPLQRPSNSPKTTPTTYSSHGKGILLQEFFQEFPG